MKKFSVSLTALGSVEIEAEDTQEAYEKACQLSQEELITHLQNVWVDEEVEEVEED